MATEVVPGLALDNLILGHVHKGKLGELGSVVVTLFEGIPGQKSSAISECAKATPGTLKALAHPGRSTSTFTLRCSPTGPCADSCSRSRSRNESAAACSGARRSRPA